MLFEIATVTALAFTVNTTEVQVNICDSSAAVENRLNLRDWKEKKPQASYFIENKQYALYKNSWVFKIQFHEDDDSVDVVLKNNAPSQPPLKPDTQDRTELKCENDLHGTQKKLACKMTSSISLEEFDAAVARRDFAALLSSTQQRWLQNENMPLPSDLQMTNAFTDQDYKKDFAQSKMTLTITHGADETLSRGGPAPEFIEISVRTDAQNEIGTQKQLLTYLKQKNVKICTDQTPLLTRHKLESYFKTGFQSP